MSDDLIFEEPPPLHSGAGGKGRSPFGLWLTALRDHPGKWAKFPEPMGGSTASTVRKGTCYGVAKGDYEVRTVRINGTTKNTIYARFVGGGES